jgi:hypothetical protein
MPPRRFLVQAAFALIFVLLTVGSYTRLSATWDEPLHLTAGYAALRDGDYRFGIGGHPALLRLWSALPLLATPGITLGESEAWRRGRQIPLARQFLYQDNDGDRLLYRARFMTVLLGIMLGLILFAWASELFGMGAATLVLAMYAFEPNILGHASLVTSDLGLSLFLFAACWFLWRSCRRLSWGNASGLAISFALAAGSKVSGLILLPMAALLLGWKSLGPGAWVLAGGRPPIASRLGKLLASLALAAAMLLAAWLVIWGAYRFRYDYSRAPALEDEFREPAAVRNVSPGLRRAIESFDRLRLLPRAYTLGFLIQLGERQRERYFAGRFSDGDIPGFYLGIFLVKTPVAIILAIAAGLVLLLRRREFLRPHWPFVLVPAGVYAGAVWANSMNTGVRHLLPLYPFLLLVAGIAVAKALGGSRGRIALLLGALLLAVDFGLASPDYLSAFNLAAGGPSRGEQWALDSNLDWGQGLKGLKVWMDRNRVASVNLSYFGLAPATYYGIDAVALPGSSDYAGARPRLPGYVAVSLTNLHALHHGQGLRDFYRPLRRMQPVAVIHRSINVYRVDRPWWGPAGG